MTMDLNDLRAMFDEHENDDDGLTADAEVCLKKGLLRERNELLATKIELMGRGKGTMAEGGADTTEIDAEIEKMDAAIKAKSITLHFRALMEPDYNEIVRKHPEATPRSPAKLRDFLAELADACLIGIDAPDGSKIDITGMAPGEWRTRLIPVEWDSISDVVWELNKNPQPLPRPKL